MKFIIDRLENLIKSNNVNIEIERQFYFINSLNSN